MSNDSSIKRQLQIGILTEKNDIKMIEQLFINKVKIQGNEGEAICSFKELFFFALLRELLDRVKTKQNFLLFRDYWIQ